MSGSRERGIRPVTTDAVEFPEEKNPVVLTPLAIPPPAGLKVQHIMFAVIVCALLFWLTIALGKWILLFAIVALLAGAVGLAVILSRRGSTQRESLLWAMAIAAERRLPLAPAALAFVEQYSGSFRVKAEILAQLLNEGTPLPQALDAVPGLLNKDADLLVRIGWSTRTLPESLRLAASARASRRVAWGGVASRFSYLVVVFIAIQIITALVLYYIAPKYEAIFKDFGQTLPPVTIWTLQLSNFMGHYWPLTLLLILLETILFSLVPISLFGFFSHGIPFIDSLFRRRHSSLVLRALALTTEGQRPVSDGLKVLATSYPSGWIRRRLKEVVRDTDRGADWVESLGAHSLISVADEAVLRSAQRAGNLPWALREIADTNEKRLGYRMQLWLQMFFPVMIAALGLLVFVMAVAYFSPIARLIEVLAG